ncbi:MAG: hypothetical protein VX834_12945 [Myxococcota bacterium]|nr:hypothetical protein [Myxococcota bacterium]
MAEQDQKDQRDHAPRKQEPSKPARAREVRPGKNSQLLTPQKPLYGGFYILPR